MFPAPVEKSGPAFTHAEILMRSPGTKFVAFTMFTMAKRTGAEQDIRSACPPSCGASPVESILASAPCASGGAKIDQPFVPLSNPPLLSRFSPCGAAGAAGPAGFSGRGAAAVGALAAISRKRRRLGLDRELRLSPERAVDGPPGPACRDNMS